MSRSDVQVVAALKRDVFFMAEKTRRLEGFTGAVAFRELGEEDRALIRAQVEAQRALIEIMERRAARLEN